MRIYGKRRGGRVYHKLLDLKNVELTEMNVGIDGRKEAKIQRAFPI